MACFGLLTFFPDLLLLSLPSLNSCIVFEQRSLLVVELDGIA
jgi:hypothetical protein